MSKYKVDITGINTNNLSTFTSKEMLELFKKYKEGDLFARDLLVEGNLKLVLSILKKFYNKTDNMDDLFQIGCVGLIKAIDNFDLSYNVLFSTYAVPMILGEIKRYLRDNTLIKISRTLKDISYKAMRYIEEFYSINGYEPDLSIVARELGVSEYDVSNALLSFKDPVSIFEPIYNEGGDTIYLCDQIEDKHLGSDNFNKLDVNDAIDNLDSREQYILNQRYIFGKTQMEISNELDISQAQVSRIETKAIKELKKSLN